VILQPGYPARLPRGFTLLELLVVLAVAGLIMAVTPPMLSKAMPGLQLKSSAREVAAGMRYARDRAVSWRTRTELRVDLEQRTVSVTGRPRPIQLSDDLDVALVTARSALEDDQRGSIFFYPDGSSTGGRITVSRGTSGYDIDLDWLTGRVSIAAVQVDGNG
jgi:general secretion pathway protein H